MILAQVNCKIRLKSHVKPAGFRQTNERGKFIGQTLQIT